MVHVAQLGIDAGDHEEIQEDGADEQRRDPPSRQVAVMRALEGEGEFRIAERQVHDAAQAVAFDPVRHGLADGLDDGEHEDADPKRLAADAAMEPRKQINPIHLALLAQGRS